MHLSRLATVTVVLTLSCSGTAYAVQRPPADAVDAANKVRIHSHGAVKRTRGHRAPAASEGQPQMVPQTRGRTQEVPIKAAATYSGLGFDTCAAPPTDVMQAWAGASPYHAVGIYIGGIDRACPDGNLTRDWIQTVSGQGWKFFPVYVGLQAPCWKAAGGRRALIARSRRWTQGQEAADDAANRAASFGIAPGSPIYFDMEYYPRNNPGCTQDVQVFLSAWTYQLHARGYVSGIYSSSRGAIADMAVVRDSGADVAWYAHWDKIPQLFGDPTLNDQYWPGPRRIKQYRGPHNETYGGMTLNIDLNVLNAPVAALQGGATAH
jgi:hypothetical protein